MLEELVRHQGVTNKGLEALVQQQSTANKRLEALVDQQNETINHFNRSLNELKN